MALIRTLIDRDKDHSEPALPPGLKELYDGNLPFHKSPAERPYVISNFVSTLDGVVSYELKGQAGGSTISGSDPADRFIMGLLRASADAIIVGSRTVQDAGPRSLWIPEYTYPDAKDLYSEYRAKSCINRRTRSSRLSAAVANWIWTKQFSRPLACAS